MPRRVAPRAHDDRHRREQHRGEAGEIEKSTGAIDGGIQLPAGFLDISQPLARRLGVAQVIAESRHRRRRPREQPRIRGPAARLDQLRRGDVVIVEQDRRRQINETRTLIRPVIENFRQAKGRLADAQHGAEFEFQLRNDARIDPYLAAAGNFIGASRGAEWRIRDAHVPTQRIIGGHGIERGELAQVAAEYRCGKRQDLRAAKSARGRLIEVALRNRRRRFQPQIRREHLRRLQAHALRNAAGEKAHGGQRQHRHQQGEQQHRELTGLQVAPQIA